MPGLPEKIWSLVASTSKGPETFFFFFFFLSSPDQFPAIQESVKIQIRSAAVATTMSDLLTKATGPGQPS